ncbi:MAG: hypothetical protein ONB30_11805 [candidate division KSB1 bacterium]|nr:hypothetical protein [candidate division KSB1 bacterium]
MGAEVWVEKGGSLCAGPEWSDSRCYYTVNVCNCVRDGGTTLTVLGVYQGQWEGNATIYHPGPSHAVRVDLYLQRLEQGVPR